MSDNLKQLQRAELFRGISTEVLQNHILPHSTHQDLQKNQFLIIPQQTVDQFSIVLSGKLHILHLFPDGNYSLMAALTTGEAVGLDLICTHNRTAPYHVAAAAPARVLSFPARILLESGFIPEESRLAILTRLLTIISDYNMKKEYRLAILSRKGLRERIITYLAMQSSKRRSATFHIPFTREEMASFLCVNRSALSHELSVMEQEGMISFRKNQFTLLQPEKWNIHSNFDV